MADADHCTMPQDHRTSKDKEYRMCWEGVCKNHMNPSRVMGMVTYVVVLVYFKVILYHNII